MSEYSIDEALSVLEAEKANLAPAQRQRLTELAKTGEDVRADIEERLEDTKQHELTPEQQANILAVLEDRLNFDLSGYRSWNTEIDFNEVKKALQVHPEALASLVMLEESGGIPFIAEETDDAFLFADNSSEHQCRRNLTYEEAVKMASEFGVKLMNWEQHSKIRGTDQNRSIYPGDPYSESWLKTDAKRIEAGRADSGYYNSKKNPSKVSVPANRPEDNRGWRGVLTVPKA